jgi:hypothetical protein
MDVLSLIELQEKTLQKQLDWIRQADKKAQILMGTNLAMIGGLLSLTSKSEVLGLSLPVLVTIGVLFPALSLVSCTSATSPRIGHSAEHDLVVLGRLRITWRKPQADRPTDSRPSLIFFGQIRRLSLEAYSDRVSEQTPERYLQDLNAQCHINATIADLKHARMRVAGSQLLVGILPWAFAIYFLRTM